MLNNKMEQIIDALECYFCFTVVFLPPADSMQPYFVKLVAEMCSFATQLCAFNAITCQLNKSGHLIKLNK